MSTLLAASAEAWQPLLRTSDSAAKQEWGQLHLPAAASPPPTPAKVASVADHDYQPQSVTSSQHRASADAEVQQPDVTSHWSIHSLAESCDHIQQDTACTNSHEQQQQQQQQQQSIAQHPSWPFESHGCAEQRQDCSRDASCPDSVHATGREFREHCAAGR